MAQMVPPTVPAKATTGEKALFKILALLPDDVTVYYDVQIKHRYADFVVISPRLGVLMIEVKDWGVRKILSANNTTVELRMGSHAQKFPHPVLQARDYAIALMDEIRGRLEGQILLNRSGPHKGNISFPVGHLAVLSNISNDDIEKCNLSQIFDSTRTMTSDGVSILHHLEGADLEKCLDLYFVPKFSFKQLDKNQIDQLRGIIHPHIVVRTNTQKLRDHYDGDEMFVSLLRVLDSMQEQKARSIGPGHRLLFGIAGSGKTTILIARAKYLAEQHPDRRGLVLCFNRPLAAYLKTQLAGFSNLTVTNFHRLAYTFGIDADSWTEEFGAKLKAAIVQSKERYDFILVDEAQDFDQNWFSCVVTMLKDQDEGDLFITGDGSQGIYRLTKFSWKSEGVQAQGRTGYLNENYRNARNIFRLATLFSGASAFGEIEGEPNALSIDKSKSVVGGGNIRVLRARNRTDEVSRAVDLVSQLLKGEWGFIDRARSINPQIDSADIGIIYPSHKKLEHLIAETLIPQIENECKAPVVWTSDPNNKANRDNFGSAIRVHTVHHAKGLQYRAVIFMWADLLPFAKSLEQENRNMFYVALTRAGQFLAITYSNPSRFVEQTIEAIEELRNKE